MTLRKHADYSFKHMTIGETHVTIKFCYYRGWRAWLQRPSTGWI